MPPPHGGCCVDIWLRKIPHQSQSPGVKLYLGSIDSKVMNIFIFIYVYCLSFMGPSNQLKEKTDNHLVNQIKLSKCNSSLSELINRHSGICVTICQRYSQVLSAEGVSLDELKEEKDYVIYQAALSYNNSKNIKFSSWLGNCMKYYCLNTINSNKKKIKLQERYSVYSPKENESQNLIKKSEDVEYINSILLKLKDKRIGKIYALRYSPEHRKPLSWKKISERMGISSQTAINLHDKGRRIIKKKANSKKIVDSV